MKCYYLTFFFSLLAINIYTQDAKLLASDGAASDWFGYSVAMSNNGEYTAVCAYGDDVNGSNSGSAYIFFNDGNSWTEQTKISPANGVASQSFGFSLALSENGNYLICGARNPTSNGSAYIYKRTGTNWNLEQEVFASDGLPNDCFGEAVAIDDAGETIVISSPNRDDNGTNSGAAYIFSRSGTTWTQTKKLLPSDGASEDQFGLWTIGMSGDGNYTIIGSHRNDDDGENSGSAYIFFKDGGNWTEEVKLTASNAEADDQFGFSCSLDEDGNYAVIGARFGNGNVVNSGAVYAFARSGTTWNETAIISASDAATFDSFGQALDINSSGNRIIVGAPDEDSPSMSSGAAYTFTRSGTMWTQQQKLISDEPTFFDFYGSAVSISPVGDFFIAGVNGDDDLGNSSGSAYVYELPFAFPIQLIDFSGFVDKQSIQLNWSTAQEINNKGFDLEKSDNSKDWEKITFVEAAENSDQIKNYSFIDIEPFDGNNFYRLKQIDLGGEFEYSNIIEIAFQNTNSAIKVFPNPNFGIFFIQIKNYNQKNAIFELYNSFANLVWQDKRLIHQSEIAEISGNFPKGVYFLRCQIGRDLFIEKIIITGD